MRTDFSELGHVSDIWEEWRFEPWKNGTAEGLYRRLTMIKSGFLGEVARYFADDYIVWKYQDGDPQRILKTAQPQSDLMVQRYLFLQDSGQSVMKKSSFLLGFRGFIEIYRYTLGDEACDGIKDIAYLCNTAKRRLSEKALGSTL